MSDPNRTEDEEEEDDVEDEGRERQFIICSTFFSLHIMDFYTFLVYTTGKTIYRKTNSMEIRYIFPHHQGKKFSLVQLRLQDTV